MNNGMRNFRMLIATAIMTAATINAFSSSEINDSHKYVDLGLPSGTLWATCNVGAEFLEDYGDHFAWGETEAKATYSEDNSKWAGIYYDSLLAMGVIDTLGNLTANYDAATVNWGDEWRTPTFEEIVELKSLDNEVSEINDVVGRLFFGNNCNTLFLPFAGHRYGNYIGHFGEVGEYWSATAMQDEWNACFMEKDTVGTYLGNCARDNGFSIRAVKRK